MQPSQSDNKKKLYVGNLPFSVGQDDLSDLVGEYGDVQEVTLIMDKATGRSRGFGFVEYATEEQAQAAIDGLNGQEIDGREVFVKVAMPKRSNDGGGYRGGGGRDSRDNRGGYRGGGRDNRDNRGGYRGGRN